MSQMNGWRFWIQIQTEYKQCNTNVYLLYKYDNTESICVMNWRMHFNMVNIGMPSFPYSFQDSEIANIGEKWQKLRYLNGFITLLLFTQFFMSDAADSLLPFPSPFYSGLNFAGCVWILKRTQGERARNCLVGEREGEQMKVMEVWRWSLNCNSSCWNCSHRGKMHWKSCQEERLYRYF